MHIPHSCPWRLAEDFPLEEIVGCGGPEHRCHLGKLDFYTVIPENIKLQCSMWSTGTCDNSHTCLPGASNGTVSMDVGKDLGHEMIFKTKYYLTRACCCWPDKTLPKGALISPAVAR